MMRLLVFSFLLIFVLDPAVQGQQPAHIGGSTTMGPITPPRGDVPLPLTGPSGPIAQPAAPPGSIVSVSDLRIPPEAVKELQRYQRSFQSGNMRDSAKHLERAIHIYPQFPAAHHNLGVCYAHLGEYDRAVAEFQTASLLDPHIVQPVISVSAAFFLQARYSEAEAAARRALDIDPANRVARYLLGRTLAVQDQNTQEAVEMLRQSSPDYSVAQLVLANVLLKRHETDDAVAELRAYLQRPEVSPKDKESIACTLEKLTKPAGALVACAVM